MIHGSFFLFGTLQRFSVFSYFSLGLERFGPIARPIAKLGRPLCSSSRRQHHSWVEQLGEALLTAGEYWLSQPEGHQGDFMGHPVFTLPTIELYCQLSSTFDPSFAASGPSLSYSSIDSTTQHGRKLHVKASWKVCDFLISSSCF